jgi:hypothetical protein
MFDTHRACECVSEIVPVFFFVLVVNDGSP